VAVTEPPAVSCELGPIRPPNEAFSLLVRLTRNCPWNRCAFCPVYKGTRFELRAVADIERDIAAFKTAADYIENLARESGVGVREAAASVAGSLAGEAYRNVGRWLYGGGRHAFLQDANSLVMKTPDMLAVLRRLKETFPSLDRITSYARSQTAAKKTADELRALREAGLTRLHIGLESGSDAVLKLMDKGVTAAQHIAGGRHVMAAGIELSEYVLLGAGGRPLWHEHALATARVLNEINPDFIRFRTLTIREGMPLYGMTQRGEFERADDEEIIAEEKLLLEHLEVTSTLASDHVINLLPEIAGKLPDGKAAMLDVIARFRALPAAERDLYKLGRRLGIYDRLADLADPARRTEVESVMARIAEEPDVSLEEVLFRLMERYI
jgi:radical SAM superfamily enzyme YgiQ (UPF0313 family)